MVQRFIWGLAALWVMVAGGAARADILYTTFGSGDSFNPDPNTAYIVTGGTSLLGYTATAMEFSPSKTATLDGARFAALSLTAGSISGAVAVDNGGVPGSTLETLGSVLVNTGGTGTIFSLTSSTHPLLTAGNPYWFILEPTDPNSDLLAGWNQSLPPVTGNGAQSFDASQTSWQVQTNATQGAFEISGSPVPSGVPEPSTLGLLGLGLLVTVWFGSRRTTNGSQALPLANPGESNYFPCR
jgi:hypothetical protein